MKPTPLTKDKEIQGWLYPKGDIKSAVDWIFKHGVCEYSLCQSGYDLKKCIEDHPRLVKIDCKTIKDGNSALFEGAE